MVMGFPKPSTRGGYREVAGNPSQPVTFREIPGFCAYEGCDLEARPDRLMCPMHFTHEPSVKTPDPPPSCPVHGAELEPARCWTCEKAKGARVACLACGRPLPSPPSLCQTCADERTTHGRGKARSRARQLTDRMETDR